MTSRKKKIEPPDTDVLSQRFAQASPPLDLPVPKAAARAPAKKTTTRPAPPGMTRVSLYLPQAAANALNEVTERVQAVGRVTKAEALAGIIFAGVDQADSVSAEMRERLRRELDT
jgi:hypothetical protein